MLTVAEIAERDGVSRPSVSGIVKRLVEQFDLGVERDARGRVARVNVAQYDRLRDRPGANARAPSDAARAYAEARAEKTKSEAERAKLELAELLGQLVRVSEVEEAVLEAATLFRGAFDTAAAQIAPDLAQAAGAEAHVVRPYLRRLREEATAAFRHALAKALKVDKAAVDAADAAGAVPGAP